ncbi:hypothetical protein HQ496_07955 [bacterium]|nr:hypothetical protein [bacterium]
MGKSNSSVLHVVVGAGIIPYFRNAVESIVRNTEDVVFAVYNTISTADADRFANFVATPEFGDRVVFTTLGNEGASKTGSLYDAYNLAIDYASERGFDYLNFVQGDCQLMWWNEGLVARLDEIFSAVEEVDGPGVLCVGTVFPVFGKFVGSNFSRGIFFDTDLNCLAAAGAAVADVGIFAMSGIRASRFRFVGTEEELQNTYRREKVPMLDVPCVAFIPWPATVRNGRVVGKVVEPTSLGSPILRLKVGFRPDLIQPSFDTEPFWMEHYIAPNGWDCLFPYWPTSIDKPKWWKRRLKACRQLGVKPWTRASQVFTDSPHAGLGVQVVPVGKDILLALIGGLWRYFLTYQRQLFGSVTARSRAIWR